MTTSAPLTAEQLLALSIPDKQVELVRGRLIVRQPPGTWHGKIAADLTYLLGDYVRRRRLGLVLGQDTGFKIATDPDTVRAPDVAFVAADRVAQIPRRGYAALAPDLAVEVVLPTDAPADVLAKVAEWLEAGTRLVWLVDPERREARVYRGDGSLTTLGPGDALEGEDVLPGLSVPLKELLG